MDKFNEIKNIINLASYIRNETGINYKLGKNNMRFDMCPFCHHRGCFDVIPEGVNGNSHSIYNCFSCGNKGTILDFYCYQRGLDKNISKDISIALNELCEYAGIKNNFNLDRDISQDKQKNSEITPLNANKGHSKSEYSFKSVYDYKKEYKRANNIEEKKEYDFTLLADSLHKNLLQDEEGLNYFQSRGFSVKIIKKYKLGYCKDGFNEAFKEYSELLLNKDFGEIYTYFIPMFDSEGVCKYILPRQNKEKLEDKLKKGELHKLDKNGKPRSYPKTINLKGVKTRFYNFEKAMEEDEVYICEGWGDALTLADMGINALSLNSVSGVNGFVREIQKISEFRYKNYVIAFDSDEAGNKAREKLEIELKKVGCDFIYHIIPVGVKDINEAVLQESSCMSLIEQIANVNKNIDIRKEEIEDKKKEELDKKIKEIEKDSCFGDLDYFIDEFEANKDKKLISTGFKRLDNALGGGLYNSLYVIGGISGLGKTSLVLDIIDNIAKEGKKVLFISLEMSKRELICKSLSRFIRESVGNINKMTQTMPKIPSQSEIYRGMFDRYDKYFQLGYMNYKEISKNIFIREANYNYNTELIKADLSNYKGLFGEAPVLVVDYLQVLPCLKDYVDDKKNIDFNITELKRISRDFNIPVIVISSIGRQYYKKPIDFEAFKSSGNIEFTADVVIGLQYSFMNDILNKSDKEIQELYNEAKSKSIREIQAVVLKNRNGGIGEFVNFDYETKYNYFK